MRYAITWRLATIAACAIALVVAFATTTPRPWALTILGMGVGCVSGYFSERTTRKGLSSIATRALTWGSGIGLLILAMALAEDMFIGAWAASFAGYLLLVSMAVLPAMFRKQHLEDAAGGT